MHKTYLVTGSAGFIGFHLAKRLLNEGHHVIGFDNLNPYYSTALKKARNDLLLQHSNYCFYFGDLCDKPLIEEIFKQHHFHSVFHLAAQAGVRYSLTNPEVYLKSNVDGTLNILEACRQLNSKAHLFIASSSSVYGLSQNYPFQEEDSADRPVALYGATKRANELMAHSYSHLFGLRTTLLRFFTVYGPWGRPDMALFRFVSAVLKDEQIEVYNHGDMIRDFTYIDDIADGILGLEAARNNPTLPLYDVFNIGSSQPKTLMEFIKAIEKSLNKQAKLRFVPFQAGDIYKTYADVTKIQKTCSYSPKFSIEKGITSFVQWYLNIFLHLHLEQKCDVDATKSDVNAQDIFNKI